MTAPSLSTPEVLSSSFLPSSKPGVLLRLYAWVLEKAASPRAMAAYCLVAFAESSFFPLPPDLLMIPMVLSRRSLAWRLAFWGTVMSVGGGIVGYGIGYGLYETIGTKVIHAYHLESSFEKFQQGFAVWGFWIIILKGLTPIPYKLVTIASGAAHFDFFSFLVASLITRSFRFYLLAALLWRFGNWAREFIEKYLALFLWASLGVIGGGFFLFKSLFS